MRIAAERLVEHLGGIIVDNDSKEYWSNLEVRKEGTIEAIIQQIKQRQSRPVQQIQQKDSVKKDKTKWSLEDI